MSAKFEDYYHTLGITREASADEIKKAFRKLARQYHPDTAKNKKTAEEKFKEINEAYEVLGDPEKRRKYDTLGADWENAAQNPYHSGSGEDFSFSGTGFSDFFEQYFSGGSQYGSSRDFGPDGSPGAARQRRPRKGHDIEGDILVTLEEAMLGTTRPISLQTANRQTGAAHTNSFQVRIPPGATDGRRIRVPGQGGPGIQGGPPGDLFLRVRHAAHPDFMTEEADVIHEIDIAPWEAVLGSEIVVPTMDGAIKLRIPAGAEHHQKLRVRGRGLPKGKTGERGDFYVALTIVLPTELSDAERSLWERLRDGSNFKPRDLL